MAGRRGSGVPNRPVISVPEGEPLFSVDASNAAQYDAVLTESTRALIKKFPDYRIDVYPSHRTTYYPQWQLDNTKKNATTVKLVGDDGLLGLHHFPWGVAVAPVDIHEFKLTFQQLESQCKQQILDLYTLSNDQINAMEVPYWYPKDVALPRNSDSPARWERLPRSIRRT